MKALRNLRTIGLLLLIVVGVGTAGFHYIEHWPWFDGLYMVVTTLTFSKGLSNLTGLANNFAMQAGIVLLIASIFLLCS